MEMRFKRALQHPDKKRSQSQKEEHSEYGSYQEGKKTRGRPSKPTRRRALRIRQLPGRQETQRKSKLTRGKASKPCK
jgi:hypothetical protein